MLEQQIESLSPWMMGVGGGGGVSYESVLLKVFDAESEDLTESSVLTMDIPDD